MQFCSDLTALFRLSGRDPHADPSVVFVVITIMYGGLFSFIAGFVAQMVANTKSMQPNYILAFILAGFAAFSLFKTTGSHWTQIAAIFIFAPVSISGGFFYNKKHKRQS